MYKQKILNQIVQKKQAQRKKVCYLNAKRKTERKAKQNGNGKK